MSGKRRKTKTRQPTSEPAKPNRARKALKVAVPVVPIAALGILACLVLFSTTDNTPLLTMPSIAANTFTAPEFTSLCPVTGQPDFAHLVIDYVPDEFIVESKSLKLFLGSFRNHGAFHEDCTVAIAKRIVAAIAPRWLRIGGYWYPRGGIPIDVFWQTGVPPEGIWLPDQGVQPYRGRG